MGVKSIFHIGSIYSPTEPRTQKTETTILTAPSIISKPAWLSQVFVCGGLEKG